MTRSRRILLSAMILLAALQLNFSATPAAALEPCAINATVVDAQTGRPATGVYWAIYRYAEERGVWSFDCNGWLDSAGRLKGAAMAGSTSKKAFLFIEGGGQFYSEYYSGYRKTSAGPNLGSVYTWVNQIGNVGDIRYATRIPLTPGGAANLGTIRLTPKPKPYGSITGRLSDSLSGRGIAGASVFARRYDAASGQWVDAGTADNIDDNGAYSIVGTADRPMTGRIKLGFYLQFTGNIGNLYWPGTKELAEAREFYIQPYQSVDGVDQQVFTPGRLGGQIIDVDHPSTVDEVTLRVYRYVASDNTWDGWTTGVVQPNGKWFAPGYGGLKTGKYRVSVRDPRNGYRETFYPRSIDVTSGQVITGIDIVLAKEPLISGVVTDDAGNAVADAKVVALRQASPGVFSTAKASFTRDNGRYYLPCLTAGTYTIRVEDNAGTATSADDVRVYYGGGTSTTSAATFKVGTVAKALSTVKISPKNDARARRATGVGAVNLAIRSSRTSYAADEASKVVLASTSAPYDALAAAGLAGAVHGPIMFTTANKLPVSVLRELDRIGAKKLYLIGNTAQISNAQVNQLKALGFSVVRLGGVDRYETSAKITREMVKIGAVTTSTPVFLVRGTTSADALAISSAAYSQKAPVLFVKPTGTPAVIARTIADCGLKHGYIISGYQVLPYWALSGARNAGMTTLRFSSGVTAPEIAAAFAANAKKRSWVDPASVGLIGYADPASSLVGGATTGRHGGMVLGAAPTSLPYATATSLTANRSLIRGIKVYAPTTQVTSSVIIQAGSR